MNHTDMISHARVMLLTTPLRDLALAMQPMPRDDIKTVSISDDLVMHYSPAFIESLTTVQCTAVVRHELTHFAHRARRLDIFAGLDVRE